jgi:hypothetical protein
MTHSDEARRPVDERILENMLKFAETTERPRERERGGRKGEAQPAHRENEVEVATGLAGMSDVFAGLENHFVHVGVQSQSVLVVQVLRVRTRRVGGSFSELSRQFESSTRPLAKQQRAGGGATARAHFED